MVTAQRTGTGTDLLDGLKAITTAEVISQREQPGVNIFRESPPQRRLLNDTQVTFASAYSPYR